MAWDPVIITSAVAGLAAIFGSAVTVLVARISAGPSTEDALTNRFEALVNRQEIERLALVKDFDAREAKLERVAADLEVMVIRFMEWADEVTVVAALHNVELPARPKFAHLGAGS